MKGFFNKLFGKDGPPETAASLPAPNIAVPATEPPKIIFDAETAAWVTTLHEDIRAQSESLGQILDLYAAGDFRGIMGVFHEIGGFVDDYMVSSVLLMAGICLRSGNQDGFNSFKSQGDGSYFHLRDFLAVLSGEMTLQEFTDSYKLQRDNELLMCIATYESASYHLTQKKYDEAEKLLTDCLAWRQPTVESFFAWCDLIELDAARRRKSLKV